MGFGRFGCHATILALNIQQAILVDTGYQLGRLRVKNDEIFGKFFTYLVRVIFEAIVLGVILAYILVKILHLGG